MNSKSFNAKKVKKNVVLDFIKDRYSNPMDFVTSPEGDAIISAIASKIGLSKTTAVSLYIASMGNSYYKYNTNVITQTELSSDWIYTSFTAGVSIVAPEVAIPFAVLGQGAKVAARKLAEFNMEFELYIKGLIKN